MKAEEIQRKHFNKIGDVYVKARGNKYHVAYQHAWWDEYFQWLLSSLPDKTKLRGMDAMCGNAEIAIYLKSKIRKLRWMLLIILIRWSNMLENK